MDAETVHVGEFREGVAADRKRSIRRGINGHARDTDTWFHLPHLQHRPRPSG
jgi:hypothetical protein